MTVTRNSPVLKPSTIRYLIPLLITFICFGAMFFVSPIKQDPAYHNFSDCRHILGVHNFWNVITNLPFLLAGIYGFHRFFKNRQAFEDFHTAYICFCIGIVLTGFGSAYYHYHPVNSTLVWDRIPMTIIFMSLLDIVVSSTLSKKTGKYLLIPLLITGVFSVLYWYNGEVHNAGDLRLYALVQFYPIIIIPVLIILFPTENISGKMLFIATGLYVLAKIAESNDVEFFKISEYLSGHSLKHLLSAGAIAAMVKSVKGKNV